MGRRVITESPLNASTPLPAFKDAITPTSLHYVRNHFLIPSVADADAWRVRVSGHVASPFELSVRDLRASPARAMTVTLECAGNSRTRMTPLPPGTPWDEGAASTAEWTGTPLRAFLDRAALKPGAREILFRGADTGEEGGAMIAFERSLPVEVARDPDTLLVWAMNGSDLPPEHGFPVRLIVPEWYGVASVKWLTDIVVLEDAFNGYFQTTRYTYESNGGGERHPEPVTRMRPRSVIASPSEGEVVRVGETVDVVGRAWSGNAPVARVEVSVDGGATFAEAVLTRDAGPHAWARFVFPWTPTRAGEFVLIARAEDAAANVQPMESVTNRFGYGNNAVLPTRVVVR